MTRHRFIALSSLVLATGLAAGLTTPELQAQQNNSRLTREQNEILRKAERLDELMQRLLTRYERDGATEKVKLLTAGLEHMKASGVLDSASKIGSNLDDGALDDALREQAKVVAELEKLLDILLDRQSVDNLDDEIEATTKMIDTADALAQRQAELRQDARDARDATASDAERDIAATLQQLAGEQRAEATANERDAGSRTPVLESALERLKSLLAAQKKLEADAKRQLAGQVDPSRAQGFELSGIEQGQREVMAQRSQQREAQRLAESAEALKASADNPTADENALREALDRARARLEASLERRNLDSKAREDLQQGLDKLKASANAVDGDADARKELSDAAAAVADAARAAEQRTAKAADAAQAQLKERTEAAAEATKTPATDDEPASDSATSRALERAAKAMEKAKQASEQSDASEAMAETSKALRQLAGAKQSFENATPNPSSRAKNMASAADQVARQLQNQRAPAEEDKAAADALDSARDALREASEKLEADDSGEQEADAAEVEAKLDASRAAIEQATKELQQALDSNTDGKAEAMAAAQERQDQLKQQIDDAKQQVQQAAQSGELTPDQAKAAEDAMSAASESAEKASQQLGQKQQSAAAKSQRKAAEQLEKAQDGMEQKRPVSQEERDAMEQVAEEQEQLEEDIIRLAELAEERKNKQAKDALDKAAEASKKASEALKKGDSQEADAQQAEAQEQLEKAKDALEEERDRYMDLRQEELLFKIGEELAQFLEAQEPLTLQTQELAEQFKERGRLSRPSRRKLNQIGERELELVERTEFLHEALVAEKVLVFSHVLQANASDLREIAQRLSGRSPDPSDYTNMLQLDVEKRARKLIDALQRERQRRKQEEKEKGQQQQQQQDQQEGNQFGNQQERLVSLIAELQMLRQMEEDMRVRSTEVERLIQVAGADGVTEFDLAMAERLAHQHGALTGLFQNIKKMIEDALNPPEEGEDPFADPKKEGGK